MTDFETETEEKTDLATPKRYKVFILNDNYTDMNFVIQVLLEIFNKSYEEAVNIMMIVHKFGSGYVATYAKEIATMKCMETENAARYYGFPLRTKVEEDD
jgi:ATP-dependent Clp protease adaptor protein ClpS